MSEPSFQRDPFAPVDASPRFATPVALAAIVVAVLGVLWRIEIIAGPVGMALGLIAHLKGSRLGMPAAIVAGVALIVGMSLTMYLR